MKIYEVSERTTKLLTNIIKVWEQSVFHTHELLVQIVGARLRQPRWTSS